MSPEQARGDDIDHRADIWSLCVVLYEIITGRIPFEGKNANATLYAIIANEPPPLVMFASGDDELWTIMSIGLAKDPDKRWQTMRTLGEALARWLRSRGVNEDVSGAALDATWRPGGDRMDSLSTVPPQLPLAGARRKTDRDDDHDRAPDAAFEPSHRARPDLERSGSRPVLGGVAWWMLSEEPPAAHFEVPESLPVERPAPAPNATEGRGAATRSARTHRIRSCRRRRDCRLRPRPPQNGPLRPTKPREPKKPRSRPASGGRAPSGTTRADERSVSLRSALALPANP